MSPMVITCVRCEKNYVVMLGDVCEECKQKERNTNIMNALMIIAVGLALGAFLLIVSLGFYFWK